MSEWAARDVSAAVAYMRARWPTIRLTYVGHSFGAQALGLESEVGSLAAGKRADLTVVSLAGSSYLPWEDPAGAVVFGGSPDRVLATYVGGELRYERGGMDWQELTVAARNARRAMLAQPAARPVAAPSA